MEQDGKKLNEQELEQVAGGLYRMADYLDVVDDTDDAYICKVCGKVYNKDICYFVDMMQHLRTEHGIDRSLDTPKIADILKQIKDRQNG